jgi:hypothetical protein
MLTISSRSRSLLLALSAFLAGFLTACESNILPMRPLIRTTAAVPDSQPTPTTTTAPSLATQKSKIENPITVTDPNETARLIYNADYDNLWRQSLATLTHAGFLFDRLDYRLGVITTKPLPSPQPIEFWRQDHTSFTNALENTINNQRRTVRITIEPTPHKPDVYRIAIQVAVERQTNPNEDLGGPVFVEGSAFGRATVTLRSDYAAPTKYGDAALWVLIGRDPQLEQKLLKSLFTRI